MPAQEISWIDPNGPDPSDRDLWLELAGPEGRVTAAEAVQTSQGRGLVQPNPGAFARLRIPRAMTVDEAPTYTDGVASAASAITSGQDIDDSSTIFRRYGCLTAVANNYTSLPNATSAGLTNIGHSWGVEFEWYGSEMELRIRGSSTARFRMWVDDIGYDVLAGRSGSMASDGLVYRHHYDFGSTAFRRIRIEFSRPTQWFGITIGPTDTIWAPSTPPGPKVIASGDSFSEDFDHWPVIAGWALGWKDIAIVGKGSTGYLDTSAGSDTFRDRAQKDIYDQDPDIVLVHGGLNDVAISPALVLAECNTFFQEIKASTEAILIVVGLNRSKGTNGSSAWIQVRDAIREAAEAHADHYIETVGGTYPYNGTFSSYDNTGWITGSGQEGTTTGSGNADLFVVSDGTHPTEAGQIYRGLRVAEGIAAAMPILGGS